MKQACDIAKKSSDSNQQNYDKRIHGVDLKCDGRVLVRNMSERGGTGKLRSHWEEKVHIVVKCHPGIPVFDVRREDRTGKVRTLHRNMLMRCDLLPLDIPIVAKNKERKKDPERESLKTVDSSTDSDSSSSEEDITDEVRSYLMKKIMRKRKKKKERRRLKNKESKKEIEVESGQVESEIREDEVERNEDETEGIEDFESENREDEDETESESEVIEDETDEDEAGSVDSEEEQCSRPVRERRAPRMLTYDETGNTYYTPKPFRLNKQ